MFCIPVSWCLITHDNIIKWTHFPRYWPFVQGIHWSPVNSPQKGQWHLALMFSLICAWINGWVNNREAGNLRCHRVHHDVIVTIHPFHRWFNSLWPSDAIWQQTFGSTLAQVMACWLMAPSHYLNQCWLIISKGQWHSSEGNFTRYTLNHQSLKLAWKFLTKFHANLPGTNDFWLSEAML